jgi:hypothetical protein
VIGAALLALVACGSPAADPASTSGADLSGHLQQYREDEVAHVLQIELRNGGPATLHVDTLRVAWSGLTGTQDATPAYDIPSGVTVALKVPYGGAVCTSATRPADPVTAVVGSAGSSVTVPLTVDDELMATLWDADCERQRILAAVGVRFGDAWTATTADGAPVLRGTLELTRGTSTTPVQVLDLDGSVLLTLDATPPASSPLLTLPATAARASLSVDVGATMRCTGHVLGESKKTYVFDVGLDLGDGKGRVDITLQPDAAVKPQMYAVITRACHLA